MTSLSIKISSLDILFSLILLEFMLLEAQALFDPDSDVTLGNKPDPTVKKTTRLRNFFRNTDPELDPQPWISVFIELV